MSSAAIFVWHLKGCSILVTLSYWQWFTHCSLLLFSVFTFSASVHLELQDFQNTELVDKWYPLSAPQGSVRSGDPGSIRLKTRYIHQVIMPEEQYTSLKDVSTLFIRRAA